MDTLHIKGEEDTPEIVLDKKNGIFEISGRSLPEDVVEFYRPVLEWINHYKEAPNKKTEVMIKVEYLNTASSKLIQDVLMSFEKIQGSKVIWYYREDDDDMDAMGHEYAEIIELPFEFKSY
jgi:hypothetical protein